MPGYQRPGVYIQETLNPIAPIVGDSSTSIAAFLGAHTRGPVTPTLVTSWSQYTDKFGGWNTGTNNTLSLAVFLYFVNGGNAAYIKRVTTGSPVAATRTLRDRAGTPVDTLILSAANVGVWGNDINITVQDSPGLTGYFDVIVKYDGTSAANVVESFPNITMDDTDSRYAPSVINAQSAYIVVRDANSATTGANSNPSNVSNQALTTGADGTTPTAANIADSVTAFDFVNNSLIINAPGVTTAAPVNVLLAYAQARTDAFVVIDPINDTVANQLTLAQTYTATSHGACYYPPISINDPTNTTPGTVIAAANPGGAVIGKYAATDKSRGVFKAPAGLSTRISGAVGIRTLTNSELDALNASPAPVNAIRFITGSGIVIMGARTLKPGYADMYVPVRRTLIYLEKALVDLTNFAVFEPNDTVLYRRISATLTSFLTNFWSQGGLRGTTPDGAFFVLCDSTNNTLASVEAGQVNIQVGVALQRPAEFVVINIGQFDGGATVTVA
jgi:phage tail sheath protein FI